MRSALQQHSRVTKSQDFPQDVLPCAAPKELHRNAQRKGNAPSISTQQSHTNRFLITLGAELEHNVLST